MAIIVLRAKDNLSGHPLAWKRGMPVCVVESGHQFSPRELLPPADGGSFVRVELTDVTAAQVETFMINRMGCTLDDGEMSTVDRTASVRRRIIDIVVDDLPNAVRQEMNRTGSYVTTWTAVRSFVRKIATGERF